MGTHCSGRCSIMVSHGCWAGPRVPPTSSLAPGDHGDKPSGHPRPGTAASWTPGPQDRFPPPGWRQNRLLFSSIPRKMDLWVSEEVDLEDCVWGHAGSPWGEERDTGMVGTPGGGLRGPMGTAGTRGRCQGWGPHGDMRDSGRHQGPHRDAGGTLEDIGGGTSRRGHFLPLHPDWLSQTRSQGLTPASSASRWVTQGQGGIVGVSPRQGDKCAVSLHGDTSPQQSGRRCHVPAGWLRMTRVVGMAGGDLGDAGARPCGGRGDVVTWRPVRGAAR